MSGRHVVLFLGALLVLALGFVMFYAVTTQGGRANMFPPLQATTLEALPDPEHPGAVLVSQKCIACHALPAPGQHKAAEWSPVLRRMASYASTRLIAPPTIAESQVILEYLSAHAKP